MDMRNKGNITREFDTGDIVVIRIQVKSIRNDMIVQKLVLKTKVPYRVLDKATPSLYWLQ